jgi:hypothetical protein
MEVTTLDLAAASTTDQTLVANTVAPTSLRGPTGSLFGGPGVDAPVVTAGFDFVADGPVDIAGVPRLSLEVTPLGDNPIIFAKAAVVDAADTATIIDEQVLPYRIRSLPGRRRTIEFDMLPSSSIYLDTARESRPSRE